jgi:hypothetical protein
MYIILSSMWSSAAMRAFILLVLFIWQTLITLGGVQKRKKLGVPTLKLFSDVYYL